MGYTHYWRDTKRITPEFLIAARQVIAASPVPLAYEHDQPGKKPVCSTSVIRFNGTGDDGHETFVFGGPGDFSFCKTAEKPYDVVVTAILALASHYGLAVVSSDGGPDDWRDGVRLAVEATGLPIDNPLAPEVIPPATREDAVGEIRLDVNDNDTKRQQVTVAFTRPGRISILADNRGRLSVYVYEGAADDPDQEPLGIFDGTQERHHQPAGSGWRSRARGLFQAHKNENNR